MNINKERIEIYNTEVKEKYKDDFVASTYDTRRYKDITGILGMEYLGYLLTQKISEAGYDGIVMDAPAGTGIFLQAIYYSDAKHLIGGDISRHMLGEAKQKFVKKSPMPSFIQFDLEHIPLKDNALKSLINVRFMVHVPKNVRINILKELGRVSSNQFFVCYYQKFYLSYWLRLLRSKFNLRKKTRKNPKGRVGPIELFNEVNTSGLNIVSIHPLFPFFSGNWIVGIR